MGLVCGCSPSELLTEFLNKDFEEIMQRGSIEEMISKVGVFDKTVLKTFISTFVEKRLNITDPDQLTFETLFELTDREFYCLTANVDNYSVKVYGPRITPHEKCIDAIVSSCSIPFVFQGTEIPEGFLVDGALMDPVGLKAAFQYSDPGANIYSSFFSLHNTGLSILEFLHEGLTDELKLAWKRAYESTQQPIDHQTAKESNVIVNLFAHGQRMYRSLMDSLTENYIFRHLFQNKCLTNPFQMYLFPIPNFNTQIGGTPEIKVQMYFTGVDLCESIAKGYGL
jgi:predicted acylesterase/phospholipase RssA